MKSILEQEAVKLFWIHSIKGIEYPDFCCKRGRVCCSGQVGCKFSKSLGQEVN